MKHNLIETFFPRPEEYVDFFVRLKKLVKASDDGKCFAKLEKMDGGYYKYVLTYEEKYIGDYVKYFDKFVRVRHIIVFIRYFGEKGRSVFKIVRICQKQHKKTTSSIFFVV